MVSFLNFRRSYRIMSSLVDVKSPFSLNRDFLAADGTTRIIIFFYDIFLSPNATASFRPM